jgi:hypothetical protein
MLEDDAIRTCRTQSGLYRSSPNNSIVSKHHAKRAVTIRAPLPDSVASDSRLHEIIAKLRKATRIEIPIGYQDETGFHLGVKPAGKEITWPPFW